MIPHRVRHDNMWGFVLREWREYILDTKIIEFLHESIAFLNGYIKLKKKKKRLKRKKTAF